MTLCHVHGTLCLTHNTNCRLLVTLTTHLRSKALYIAHVFPLSFDTKTYGLRSVRWISVVFVPLVQAVAELQKKVAEISPPFRYFTVGQIVPNFETILVRCAAISTWRTFMAI